MKLVSYMTLIASLSFAIYFFSYVVSSLYMLYHLYIDITLAVNKKDSTHIEGSRVRLGPPQYLLLVLLGEEGGGSWDETTQNRGPVSQMSTAPHLPRTGVINLFCIKRLLTNSQLCMSIY